MKLERSRTIINNAIKDLINLKQNLNEEIEDIIYGDMNKVLSIKDAEKINELKYEIKFIYDIIETLERDDYGMEVE